MEKTISEKQVISRAVRVIRINKRLFDMSFGCSYQVEFAKNSRAVIKGLHLLGFIDSDKYELLYKIYFKMFYEV